MALCRGVMRVRKKKIGEFISPRQTAESWRYIDQSPRLKRFVGWERSGMTKKEAWEDYIAFLRLHGEKVR